MSDEGEDGDFGNCGVWCEAWICMEREKGVDDLCVGCQFWEEEG